MVKRLRYLQEIYSNRPGSQTIEAFNRSLRRAGVLPIVHHPHDTVTNIARNLDGKGVGRNFFRWPGRAYLVAMMWPKTARLFPVGYWAEIVPLCFDCWPDDYRKWERIFLRYRVRTACFTARQSARFFRERIPVMESLWIPEAADPLEYDAGVPLVDRAIDVLELGRRMESYHQAIAAPLQRKQYRHIYARGAGRIFPAREELMDAWKQTKVSVCFPKSRTAPERSGGVETVTFRYFESMAAKCLIVGSCPRELKDLFGYNPVIEANESDYAGQLFDILSGIDSYQKQVEMNYQRMLEVGTWDVRVQELLTRLRQRGYAVAAT